MSLKMTKELNNIFSTCAEDSLSPKMTHLVSLATHLAAHNETGARDALEFARASGATVEEVYRVGCLCACTAGPRVQDIFLGAMRDAKPSVVPQAYNLDMSVFLSTGICSDNSLDKKTTHLVGLAACLTARCDCAQGHIVEARNAGATDVELARCACIVACTAGLDRKYIYLEALESVKGCKACDC